jgi:hypothetical protein
MTSGEVDVLGQLKSWPLVQCRHTEHTLRAHYAHTATRIIYMVLLGTCMACGEAPASTHGYYEILASMRC